MSEDQKTICEDIKNKLNSMKVVSQIDDQLDRFYKAKGKEDEERALDELAEVIYKIVEQRTNEIDGQQTKHFLPMATLIKEQSPKAYEAFCFFNGIDL